MFLSDVREAGRKARLAIGLYAPPLLGRGIGTEAIGLVLRHAFGTLGMHRVDLMVLADNARAIAAYRACGFVEEGRERESCFVDGQLARRRRHGRARPRVRPPLDPEPA